MKTPVVISRLAQRLAAILTILFSIVVANCAQAQWTNTARGLLGEPVQSVQGGAMTYKGGVVWAGYLSLYSSRDSGVTWKRSSLPALENAITDIQFYDSLNGLVTDFSGTVYKTSDAGATWKDFYEGVQGSSACFAGSSNNVIFVQFTPAVVAATTDNGKSWSSQTIAKYGRQLLYRDGVAYLNVSSDPEGTGLLYRSSDAGLSWQPTSGVFDNDSYSFGFDSCGQMQYLVNEAVIDALDNTSEIYLSSDKGNSWRPSIIQTPLFFTGGLAISNQAVYCPTVKKGILRTTDQGSTWASIGGPTCSSDASFICAINDNLILAIDQHGSVWRTDNSGGFPIAVPSSTPAALSKNSLFANDTVSLCAPAIDTILFSPPIFSRCYSVSLTSARIVGADSIYYSLRQLPGKGHGSQDSFIVVFAPNASRTYAGQLELRQSDRATFSVGLGGIGRTSPDITLSSQDVLMDTIGAVVSVPIRASQPLAKAIDLKIFYDTTLLDYAGTFRDSILLPTSSARGVIALHFDATTALSFDSIIAVMRFHFYPTSEHLCTTILIDSLTFEPDNSCISGSGTSSTICTSPACGLTILSDFMQHGEIPEFAIAPNPARNVVRISASSQIANAHVAVLNALGSVETQQECAFAGKGIEIDLTKVPTGAHYVRIEANGFVRSYPVMVVK